MKCCSRTSRPTASCRLLAPGEPSSSAAITPRGGKGMELYTKMFKMFILYCKTKEIGKSAIILLKKNREFVRRFL